VAELLVASESLVSATSFSGELLEGVNRSITLTYRQTSVETTSLIESGPDELHNGLLKLTIKNNSKDNGVNSVDNLVSETSFFYELKDLLRRHPVALMIMVMYVTFSPFSIYQQGHDYIAKLVDGWG
jgi:hypothetical protein